MNGRVDAKLKEVLAELGRMKQKVDKPPQSSLESMIRQVESPFKLEILETRLLSKFRMLVIDKYT